MICMAIFGRTLSTARNESRDYMRMSKGKRFWEGKGGNVSEGRVPE